MTSETSAESDKAEVVGRISRYSARRVLSPLVLGCRYVSEVRKSRVESSRVESCAEARLGEGQAVES